MAPEDDAAETTGEEKMDVAADAAQVASVMVVSSGLKRGRGVLVDALDGIMPDTLWSPRRHHHMRGARVRAPFPGVRAFIGGTFAGILRPKRQKSPQEYGYSGHKHCLGMNYQGLVTPDGLITLDSDHVL
ncbi:hypothetical protein M885DRAFT_602403 [Pelagophyceae sp. CCMP2097]|nr:hypothetical protein M885DRAFT_602403 [Pelagophyceae sp. CCMP2097]